MTRTLRVFWPNATSGWFNFNWFGVIDFNSVVHIAACEGQLNPPDISGSILNRISRTRGDASIYVKNVHPHNDGVEFFLQVDWDSPLNVVIDITVVDPPEDGSIVS